MKLVISFIVVDCGYYYNLISIDKLCKKQQLLCVQDIGPWVRFPDTLHEGYGHLAQVMGKFSFQ